MKKFFVILAISLLSLLAAVSCRKTGVKEAAEEVAVTVRFGIEDAAAVKSGFSTGSSATVLEYRVYILQGASWKLTNVSGKLTGVTYPKDITLHLAADMTYRIACFAQSPAAETAALYNLADFDDIAISYAALLPNSDMGDVFCATRQFVSGDSPTLNVVMHRPLAQFNVYTGDLSLFNASSVDNPVKTVQLKFHGVPVKMSLVQGTADAGGYVPFRVKSDVQDYEFTCDVLTGMDHSLGDETYDHLSMNYLLAAPQSDITTVDLTLKAQDGTVIASVPGVSNVPYQANYRTNLYGSLITNAVNFSIDLDPAFNDPDYAVTP